ncbi:protein S100-Z-like isoform X1 [Sinocyclocheilus anshuiensis]|uniref:protein S100-Z-like isoform X1 n=2 Tax=Sinocyclocheilus anshuiensis TaxID=1608454 RepID=UPI0007B9E439|nr:PREDICTED: protein S100-Z-like isoform X1 [Sinocyclocheilus anshuiensis]
MYFQCRCMEGCGLRSQGYYGATPVLSCIVTTTEDGPSCTGYSKTTSSTPENSLFTNTQNFTSQLSTRCSAAVMPSKLEGAMDALITVFHNYSGSEGDKYKLSKGELKELLNSELTDFLTSQKDPHLVEKIMNDLDSNKDNEVDFNEFVVLVAALTVACNDFFQEQQKKKGK